MIVLSATCANRSGPSGRRSKGSSAGDIALQLQTRAAADAEAPIDAHDVPAHGAHAVDAAAGGRLHRRAALEDVRTPAAGLRVLAPLPHAAGEVERSGPRSPGRVHADGDG